MKNQILNISSKSFSQQNRLFSVLFVFLFSNIFLVEQASAQKVIAAMHVPTASMKPPLSHKDSVLRLGDLQRAIDGILQDQKLGQSSIGIVVHSLDANKRYYARNEDVLLTPASTTKLVSSFAAFERLGSDFKTRTSVYATTHEIRKGTLHGDIYLVGSGDPLLREEDVHQLAGQLLKLGIDTIAGNVFADASTFDGITDRKAYSGDADVVQALPPITGLTINRNSVTITVTGGKKAGSAPVVRIHPNSDAISVSNTAKVGGKGNISVYPVKGSTGKRAFVVAGVIPAGKTQTYYFSVEEPDIVAAGTLTRSLRSFGVVVAGKPLRGEKPKNAALLTEVYRPLSDIISIVNKNSDNFVAEHVFKMVGGIAAGAKEETAKASMELIRKCLSANAVPCSDCAFNDGSGLSRRNLVTSEALLHLLTVADKKPFSHAFYESFAIAGVDGTLKKRMKRTPAENNLVGKTGTLRNVSALAGYVTTMDGERLAFSIIYNGNNVGYFKSLEDRIGAILASFSFYGV